MGDRTIVLDVGSGVLDLNQKLDSLPPFDPSVSGKQDPETGEMVVCKDGKEVARVVMDNEPQRPLRNADQRLRDHQMIREHFDPSTCYDAPGRNVGDPSTFTGPMLPPGPLKLIEHHCPPDSGDK